MLRKAALAWGFAGCKSEGRSALIRLLQAGYVPRFVCVLEEIPGAEKDEFAALAKHAGAAFYVSRDLCDRVDELRALDVLLTCRFNLLSEDVFTAPRLGAVNIHQSLLPAYRGVHPTSWALIRGERLTGVSIHRIDAGIDTGDVLAQRAVRISDDDDLTSLSRKLVATTGDLVIEFWRMLDLDGRLPAPLKVSTSEPTFYARRRKPADGRIDWSACAEDIRNLVRALPAPLPQGYCERPDGEMVTVRKVRSLPPPGTVLARTPEGCYVVANGDAVSLIETDATLAIGECLR